MTAKDLKSLIRPMKQRRRERLRRRRCAQVGPSRALARIELVEGLQARIEPFVLALCEELPQLEAHRRFFDGAWELGVSADLPRGSGTGRDSHAYSRLVFEIRVDAADRPKASVVCHVTAFDRDVPTMRLRLGDLEDLSTLEAFVERACLVFVRDFWAASPSA